MCKFLSILTQGDGIPKYFTPEMRKKHINSDYCFDSHASIAEYFGLDEDKCNKYEYNPFNGRFDIDTISTVHDAIAIKQWCRSQKFTELIEQGLFEYRNDLIYSLPQGYEFPDEVLSILIEYERPISHIVKWPKRVLNDLSIPIEYIDYFEFPEHCGSLTMFGLHGFYNQPILPKLDLSKMTCGNITIGYASGIKSGFKFPEEINGYLKMCSIPELDGVELPKRINGNFEIDSVTSLPDGFKFPMRIKDVLDMRSLRTIGKGVKFPKGKYNIIIKSSRLGMYVDKLPKNHVIDDIG